MTKLARLGAVLVPLAIVASGCGLVGGGGGSYRVTAFFPRAVALYEEGQVRVLGLPAGRVQEIVTEAECPTDPTDSNSETQPCVRVELSVDDDVELPFDVSATLIPQSLIGERYVQLTPAYTDADADATPAKPTLESLPEDERIIPLSRTIVPVEPDEALAAVNEFLESLDPDGLGRLIENSEEALRGNGPAINDAIGGLADVVDTLAQRDDELAAIVDSFDAFTQTLVTREGQIGEVIESFARTARILADERNNLETLLAGLARVSSDGFDLVSEHATALRTDLDILSRVGQSLVANLDSVAQLLDAGPLLTDGLSNAYNPTLRAMNLVTSLGPLAFNALNPVLRAILGFDLGCIRVDTVCIGDPGLLGGILNPILDGVLDPILGGASDSGGEAAVTDVPVASTPIDDVLAVLGSPLVVAEDADTDGDGIGDRVAGGAGAFGRFLRDAAETLVGAG